MLSVSGKNLIGYSVLGASNHFFYGFDPKAGMSLPQPFSIAMKEEVELALQLAANAAALFRNWSPQKRKDLLHAIANKIEENSEPLIYWFTTESGLPADRAKNELARACFQLRTYGDAVASGLVLDAVIDPADEDRKPFPKPDLRRVNVALGPVVVFGASNFPFAYSTIGGDVASALAAGCPVIVKAHPMHPHTSSLSAAIIAEVAREKGCPEGVFSHLLSDNYELGKQLVLAPEVKAVGFTGSIRGGRALMDLASSRKEPIPVFAEMGSVNPIVVTKAVLKEQSEQIAQKIADSVALNAGQFCTSPGLLFVPEGANGDSFLSALKLYLQGKELQCMLHPGIFESYKKAVLDRATQLDVLVSGERSELSITPVLHQVCAKDFLQNPQLSDEVFGSYLLCIPYKDDAELLELIRALEGQLTGSVFCSEVELLDWFLALQEKVGRIIINGVPTGVEVSFAQQHGGPYPSSSNSGSTSVGANAVRRFMRPLAFQNSPQDLLPDALKKSNPWGILRIVNGTTTIEPC
ncbi:MAG: aldehyde dehydrogenase (NADP(+)) [Fluviicola sp.]|jgi:NADP-dependent aldehyde dehydrogenase